MKVLIVRAFPNVVDLQKNSYNHQEVGLAMAFLALGHEAGIVYYGDKLHADLEYPTSEGHIKIYYRKALVLLKRIAFFENFNDLKEEYDLIISNEYDQIETVKTVSRYSNKTLIYHGPYYSKFNVRYNLANTVFDFCFAKKMQSQKPMIVTKSRLAKEYLEKKGFFVRDEVGVGINEFQLLAASNEINPMLGRICKDNINLLYVGRIEPRRNTIFLLSVLKELVQIDSRYRLVMVGTGDENYIRKVKKFIVENELCDYIIYKKMIAQNQLPYVYENCNLFLLPTEYEIWGMVLMEAMRFHLPILSTYNGGSSSLIVPGKNGHILALDIATWVNAVLTNKYDLEELTEVNERILESKCNWKRIAKKMLSVFEKNAGNMKR